MVKHIQELAKTSHEFFDSKHFTLVGGVGNDMRLQTRGKYPLPKVVATKTPHLDSYLKTELSSATKSDDKELAKIQTFMLDALAPLTLILEADSEKASYDEVIDATKAAVALISNANAKISHLR